MSVTVSKRSLAVAAWNRLVRIHQRLDAASEALFRRFGLSTARFDVLARVRAHEGLTQDELAGSLLVTKGNVSQLVAKMEAEGLLERRPEGRTLRLFLSPRGRALADEAVPLQEELLAQSMAELSAADQAALVRLLRRWEGA